MPNLEEVFCDSGVPEYTYVEPEEYGRTKVAVRTPGKGLIIEGPSGIGKTTCLKKVLEDLKFDYRMYSARKPEDVKIIENALESPEQQGYLIVDDFHKLPEDLKSRMADLLKVLAEKRSDGLKLILIGINSAGSHLVQIAEDLNDRIDTIKVGVTSPDNIRKLIEKGEDILNVKILHKDELISKCHGNFHIAQMLGKELCIQENVTETLESQKELSVEINKVINKKMMEFDRIYKNKRNQFACGNRNRRGGKAPYLWILMKLAESESGMIDLKELSITYPDYKASLRQLIDRNHINTLLDKHNDLRAEMYYDASTNILTIDQPKFFFYLQNTDWKKFAREMGFHLFEEDNKYSYDIALSFAGEVREFAEEVTSILKDEEISVFYDFDESCYILGRDVRQYLGPIYSSGARYVVPIINKDYAEKVWPAFEASQYMPRYESNEVIPIIWNDMSLDPTSELSKRGHFRYNGKYSSTENARNFCDILKKRLDDTN